MTTLGFTESTVEEATLSWFEELGYSIRHGPDIAPGEIHAERSSYAYVVLIDRLNSALARINPTIPKDVHQAIQDGTTVPIYYEARIAKMELKEEERPKIDPEFEEVTEDEEEFVKHKLKSKMGALGGSGRLGKVNLNLMYRLMLT